MSANEKTKSTWLELKNIFSSCAFGVSANILAQPNSFIHMRMYPPLPFLDRVCTIDGYAVEVRANKFVIPRGVPVFIPVHAIQWDPQNDLLLRIGAILFRILICRLDWVHTIVLVNVSGSCSHVWEWLIPLEIIEWNRLNVRQPKRHSKKGICHSVGRWHLFEHHSRSHWLRIE